MASSQAMEPSEEVLKDLHFRMVRIRHFEEEAGRLMEQGKSPGALHLYIGEEAVASGVMVHLSDQDQITSTHRGHGHLVAKGGEFKLMYAELFGRETGYNKGRGGSMHISNVEAGMLGANGIVAAGPPIAVGAAFTNKYLARIEGRDSMNVGHPLLWRRRDERGRLPRGGEYGRHLEAAGRLRLREQRLRRVHPPGRPPGDQRHRRPRGGLRHAGRRLRRHGRCRGLGSRGRGD